MKIFVKAKDISNKLCVFVSFLLVLSLRFLTDLAVNVKFCLNSNPIYFHTNMKYNISTKGSFSMTQIEQIEKMIAANGGMIQTSQITDAGISKQYFTNM